MRADIDDWLAWSLADAAPDGWAHHGLAVLPDGTVVGYHPGEPQLLFFRPDGTLRRSVPCEVVEAHAIVACPEGIWIADCGHKLSRDAGGEFTVSPAIEDAVGQVILVDLEGRTLRRFGAPDHPAYQAGGSFLPTGIAFDERGVWIADGYGSNLVHLVDQEGGLLLTIEGFDCPHGILVDDRGAAPELYVAERGARRMCVHALDGTFLRHVGVGDLLAPCAMVVREGRLFVTDLVGRVSVFDADDALVGHHGSASATERPGWPNQLVDGVLASPDCSDGRFNSPHGIAVDASGDVLVSEWLLGGRWVRFRSAL